MKQFILGKIGGKTLSFEYELKPSPITYLIRYGESCGTSSIPLYLKNKVIHYWLDYHDQYDRETLWKMFGKELDVTSIKVARNDVHNYIERRVMSPAVYDKLIVFRPRIHLYLGDTIIDFFMGICKEIMFSDNPEVYL